MNFLKNRKGDEKSEFFSIILAVGGILLIGGLGFLLYSSFVNQDLNNAKKFVDSLKSKIENLKDGENNSFNMRGIEDWILVAWNKDVKIVEDGEAINGTVKPQKCFGQNCLCLCKETIANCGEIGFCRNIDRNVEVSSRLQKEYVYIPNFNQKTGTGQKELSIGNFNAKCIYFFGSPIFNLFIDKKNNSISISQDYGLFNNENTYTGSAYTPRLDLYFKLLGDDSSGVLTQCVYKNDIKTELLDS